MSILKKEYIYLLLIFIISLLFVFDLFYSFGRPATFDGTIHVTLINQFYNVMKQGEFPVRWLDGFGNYGMPVPLFAHQLPIYLGAFLMFITHNAVAAYNLVSFIGIFLSCILYYLFLRFYFSPILSFVGVFLFNFAPYRIIDFYIRGAMPEGFATMFLPLILIGTYQLIVQKKISGFFFIIFALAALALSHPFSLVLFAFIFIPYLFFLLLTDGGTFELKNLYTKGNLKLLLVFVVALIIGMGIASYYLIPLSLEIKYFYYGLSKNHLTDGQFMGLINYLDPNWYYFYRNDIFTRGHFVKSGIPETISVIIGVWLVVVYAIKGKYKTRKFEIFEFALLISIVIVFFTTKFTEVFYKHIDSLSNIQFPWRMFSAFEFLPPILFATYLKKINNTLIILGFVLFVCIIRFPQLYGKNYTVYPQSSYDFTKSNLESVGMNTIWTGRTEDYPLQRVKVSIIQGRGNVLFSDVKNSTRKYVLNAQTSIRMVDYTFYFPGWRVYVDGIDTPIEFQDPNYRGVITYIVPQGRHTIQLRFEDTTIRKYSKMITIFFIGIAFTLFLLRKRIKQLIYF